MSFTNPALVIAIVATPHKAVNQIGGVFYGYSNRNITMAWFGSGYCLATLRCEDVGIQK